MNRNEWTRISNHDKLGLGLLHAYYIRHAYPRHSHEYYVISLIHAGQQSFTHKGTKHYTPAGGVIFINPEEAHTGEAANPQGFELYSLYPSIQLMETVAFELTGKRTLPVFQHVRVDHRWATRMILSIHQSLYEEPSGLETESRLLWNLTELTRRYANLNGMNPGSAHEGSSIQRAKDYIHENFSFGLSLNELSDHVGLSPYYFLRAFRAEVGMPPHAYLESVRVSHAQQLIKNGMSLAEVALEAGFSSQSHFTNRFKKFIGVTPGQYAGLASR